MLTFFKPRLLATRLTIGSSERLIPYFKTLPNLSKILRNSMDVTLAIHRNSTSFSFFSRLELLLEHEARSIGDRFIKRERLREGVWIAVGKAWKER